MPVRQQRRTCNRLPVLPSGEPPQESWEARFPGVLRWIFFLRQPPLYPCRRMPVSPVSRH